MFEAKHEEAAAKAFASGNPDVATAWAKYKAAGGGFLAFLALLAQYGPQILTMIEALISQINPPSPPTPAPATA